MTDTNLIDLWNVKQEAEKKRIETEESLKLKQLELEGKKLDLEKEKFEHQKAQEEKQFLLKAKQFELEKEERRSQIENQKLIMNLLLKKM